MDAIRTDPLIMHGTPCFAGTRVPVTHLFEFLEAGENIDEFLRQFPTVERKHVLAVLEVVKQNLLPPTVGAA